MSYTKQNFKSGDKLFAKQLENMEDGILERVSSSKQNFTDEQKTQIADNIGLDESNENGIPGDVVAIANLKDKKEPVNITKYEKGSINSGGDSTYRTDSRARSVGIHTAGYDKTLYSVNGVKGICAYFFDEKDNVIGSVDWCAKLNIAAGSRYRLILSLDPYAAKDVYHDLKDILANYYFVNEYLIVKQVKELAEEFGGGVPAYVDSESARVIVDVTNAQTEKTLNIAALTDWHVYTNGTGDNIAKNNWAAAKHAIKAISAISKKIKLDAVVCLGDYITGDSLMSADGWLEVLGTFNEYLSDVKTYSLVKTYGNHDSGYGGNVFISPAKNRPYIAAYNDHMNLGNMVRGYGYKDLPNHKVRIIVVNTCEFNSAGDYSKSFLVSNAQYKWFADALDLSFKEDAAQWQTLIISHHPLDWSGSTFPSILSAYKNGSSVTVNGAAVNYSGKNAARIIGNIHGHLHNMLKGTVAGTNVNRWCVPNICYDYSNTYDGWKESTTYPKTAGTAMDTAFYVFCINLDTGVVKRIHYGAGYSDATDYMDENGGGTVDPNNLVTSSVGSDGKVYNGGLGYKDGYRLNSSGAEAELAGRSVTGFMPFIPNDDVYAYGIGWNNSIPGSNYIAFYDASFKVIQSVSETEFRNKASEHVTANGDINGFNVSGRWGYDFDKCAYIRISGTAPGSNFVVTKV